MDGAASSTFQNIALALQQAGGCCHGGVGLSSDFWSPKPAGRRRITSLLDPALMGADVCDLETLGRVTGRRRVVELWFAAEAGAPDRLYFLSGGRAAAGWVKNIAVDGRVRVAIHGRWFQGVGNLIEDAGDDALKRRPLAAKYQGWREGRPLSAWARESLPVAVDLDAEDGAG